MKRPKKPKVPSPLEGLGAALKKMDVAALRKKMQGREQEREEAERRPPKSETASCMVCGGTVSGRYQHEFTDIGGHMILGPGSRHQYSWVFKGYHCTRCGLKYEFLPPAELATTTE